MFGEYVCHCHYMDLYSAHIHRDTSMVVYLHPFTTNHIAKCVWAAFRNPHICTPLTVQIHIILIFWYYSIMDVPECVFVRLNSPVFVRPDFEKKSYRIRHRYTFYQFYPHFYHTHPEYNIKLEQKSSRSSVFFYIYILYVVCWKNNKMR